MATTKPPPAPVRRRTFQLPLVDGFLWLVRITVVVLVVVGAYNSLTSGRLSLAQWRDLVVFGISQGAVYGLIALGYSMVYGVLKFINFAHGEIFMIGAMTGFFATDAMVRTALWAAAPIVALFIVLLICMAVSGLVAVLLERIAYRSLRGRPRLISFITAIGASFFLQYTVRGMFGPAPRNYPEVHVLEGWLSLPGFRILKIHLLVIVAAVLMMTGLYLYLEKTKAGRAMRAVSEDQDTARLMGIDVDRTIARVFAVGGAMAGAAGLLFGLLFQSVNFFSGFLPGIKAFAAAVLGGIGNPIGAMLGGLILGSVESVGPSLVLFGLDIPSAHQLKDVVAFLTLVLVLIFRPSGILGERVSEDRA